MAVKWFTHVCEGVVDTHPYTPTNDFGWGISPLFMCTNLVSEPQILVC